MMNSIIKKVAVAGIAAAMLVGASTNASAAIAEWSGSSGTLGAKVIFDNSSGALVVTLLNTSTSPSAAPADLLTTVLFNVGGATLTPNYAVASGVYQYSGGSWSTVSSAAANVGGNWRYQTPLASAAPSGQDAGISSTGLNWFGSGSGGNFANSSGGTVTPALLDGPPLGIATANFDQTAQSLKSNEPLVVSSVTFYFNQTVDVNRINDIFFQFGTSRSEPSFVGVPEPGTMIAGALLLLPFAASTVRFIRKNRKA